MYNFAKQKDIEEMLEEFEHFCSRFEEVKLFTTESKIKKYNCVSELGIVVYYLDGEAIAYLDNNEETLYILEQELDAIKTLDILAEITHELQQKVYLELESKKEYFAKDLNNYMYRQHSFEKEQGISIEEQEELDWKVWREEEARQAYACNKGIA